MEGTRETKERLKKPNYELSGTFEEPQSTVEGLTRDVIKKLKFKSVTIDTENKKLIIRTNKRKFDPLEFEISLAKEGASEINQGVQGDKKTPKGKFKIQGKRLPENDPMAEVFTRDGKASMGPSFLYINAVDEYGNNRGIGIHGSNENEMRDTLGCVRLFNDDLLLIQDKLTIGVEIVII